MNPTPRIRTAERFGRWLGRGWRVYLRGERRVLAWMADKGVPTPIPVVLVWAVKLVVLGVLLYVAFWVALLFAFAVMAAWVARNVDWRQPAPEWRNGTAGFGLYTYDNFRIDPHVTDDD